MTSSVEAVFRAAGCEGFAHCREIGTDRALGFRADEPVVAASVFKVGIALELFRQSAMGEIDATEQVELLPGQRTSGPTGISHCRDPVRASLRDLAYLMLTISDNAATDEILSRVSIERMNATAADLGLSGTKTVTRLRDLMESAGEDHGFAGWRQLMEAVSGKHGEAARERASSPDLILKRRGLDPSLTNRTTAADTTRLLNLIWTDRAGDEGACALVRWMMSEQIDRSRLGSAFGSRVFVSAKSGSLFGVVKNEVGVATYPDGKQYAVAVFTRAAVPFAGHWEVSAAIGQAAKHLVDALRADAA